MNPYVDEAARAIYQAYVDATWRGDYDTQITNADQAIAPILEAVRDWARTKVAAENAARKATSSRA